ncbi:MAG: hypothetical protein Q8T11_05545 [Elusimicrobiota bacterium]|nr:hypothetical protein [Elusimicrobiota bacterium]
MSGSSAPAFAQVVRGGIGGAGVHAPAAGALTGSASAINPALNGGVSSIQGSLAPTMVAPSAALTPALSAPIALAPAKAVVAASPLAAVKAEPVNALASARTLAAAIGDENLPKGPDQAKEAADQAFDGALNGGTVETPSDAPFAHNGAPLAQLYPRVVFVQDVFSGPASEKTVEYVNKLVDAGVHVVFLTWRPHRGADSADSVLMTRVKQSRNNPVIVVSYNGGKVSLHGRAANPKPLIESVGAFPVEALAKIKKLANVVEAVPTDAEAFSVTVKLVEGVKSPSLNAQINALNRKFKAAGLDYKAEAHPNVPGAAIIHSMPLRFSLARVMQALETQFAGENLSKSPEKFLILSDSVKSPRFSTAFPKNSEIQVVRGGAAMENVLGAVLGDRALGSVSLKLGKLRQYVEYWEPSHSRARNYEPDAVGGSGGGGSIRRAGGDRETNKMFAMYVGTIMFRMMAQLYDDIFRGQHQLAKLTVLQAQLRSMWYAPLKHGVYVNKGLAKIMSTPAWKAQSKGYLEYANSYLTNFYFREFGDYTRAARNVQENYVGLSTDRKSLITLEFVSAATGKLYKIHTRIPRVMRLEMAQGLTLTAYAYRTGKETPDDGEEFLARVLAMAMLKGHARKGPDGKWHHGSPEGKVIESLNVQLEYRTSARLHIFKAEDFLRLEEGQTVNGPIVQEIISAIEREEADAEYQAYYAEQEQEATKDDLKKNKKPAAKKTAVAKAKPAAKKPAVKGK